MSKFDNPMNYAYRLIGAALLAMVAYAPPVKASLVTYSYTPGSTITFADGDTVSLAGKFTIDPTGTLQFSFPGDTQTVIGGPFAGTYSPFLFSQSDSDLEYAGPFIFEVFLEFSPSNDTVIIIGGELYDNQQSIPGTVATSFTGGAIAAVPEPYTWAMMLLGFAGIGFLAYRRNSTPALSAA